MSHSRHLPRNLSQSFPKAVFYVTELKRRRAPVARRLLFPLTKLPFGMKINNADAEEAQPSSNLILNPDRYSK